MLIIEVQLYFYSFNIEPSDQIAFEHINRIKGK